jgi:hypothetical protein
MSTTEYEYDWDTNGWSTHQPFLEAYVRRTSGDVLEFGIGHGSTGLLRHILSDSDRMLVSIEDNLEWFAKMKSIYPERANHRYIYLEPKEDGSHWKDFLASYTHPNKISIAFIDQAPWEARVWTLQALLDKTEYCMIHDADYFCGSPDKPGMLGNITDSTLPWTDEARYHYILDTYKLYFPPAPWTERNHGPPTLVTTSKKLPILPYDAI